MGKRGKGKAGKQLTGKEVELSEEEQKILDEAITEQLEAFRKKFGRDPLPHEPLFFDPDKDVPTALELDDPDDQILEAMRLAGIAPQFIYAYDKTGFMISKEDRKNYPEEVLREYQAAIEEYFELEKAGKLPTTK